jgi:hypothetical protein
MPGESPADSETVGNLLERLISHPQMREQIEEIRARQGGQTTPAPSDSSSAPAQGPAR